MNQAQQPAQFRPQFQQVLSHIEILKQGKIPPEIQQELFVCQKEELDNLVKSVCQKGFKFRVKLNYRNTLASSGFFVSYNYLLRQNCIEIELVVYERKIPQKDYEQLERLKTESFVEIHEVDLTTLYIKFNHPLMSNRPYNLEDFSLNNETFSELINRLYNLEDFSLNNGTFSELINRPYHLEGENFPLINVSLLKLLQTSFLSIAKDHLLPRILEKLRSFPPIITLYIDCIYYLVRGILLYPKKFAIEEIKFINLINKNQKDGWIFTEISLYDTMPNYYFFLQWKASYQNKVNSFHLFTYYTFIELLALGLTQDEESLHDDWHIFLTRGLYDPRLLLLISSYF